MSANDKRKMPIPPRGVVDTVFTVDRVRHGWDVTVQIRELDPIALREDSALMQAALFLLMDGVRRRPDIVPLLHKLLDEPMEPSTGLDG